MKDAEKFDLAERIKSFEYAFRGISLLLLTQHNARVHAFAAVAACALGFFFGITSVEWGFVIFSISTVFAAEAFNSAVEFLADQVSPEYNHQISKAKDVSAAGVLIASIGAAGIGLLVFLPYFLRLVGGF